jgi:hypothetical protein
MTEPDPTADATLSEAGDPMSCSSREASDPMLELRGELAAAGAESRRTARRQMEVMKEFGTAIDAMGRMVHDLHSAARDPMAKASPAAPPASDAAGLLLPLIEMADRLGRTAAAFQEPPVAPVPWWPGVRAAIAPWQVAWTSQRDALFILCSHMDTLLVRAGLQRISVAGGRFDPGSMTAVEVITDSSLPDHTVVAEILSGWQQSAGGAVVRPAQVRVSRQS